MFFVLFVFFVISVIYINGGLFLDFRLKKLWSFVICDILRMWLILSFMWAIVVFLKDGWPSGIKTDDRLINKYDSDVGNGMYRLWNGWLVFMLFSFQACQDLAFFEPPAGHIATGKTCYIDCVPSSCALESLWPRNFRLKRLEFFVDHVDGVVLQGKELDDASKFCP